MILLVTHSIEEAIRVGNRILLLSAYPGTVKGRFAAPVLTKLTGPNDCCRRGFMKSCFLTYETNPSKVMP
jgi:ABC-type nitrate/sulfonate/bicarbonate transport system ATPase subunit